MENRGSEMGSSKQRKPSRLLKVLTFMIYLLSSLTLIPIFLPGSPPSAPFYAFLAVSVISANSSPLLYFSGPNPLCFAFFLASSLGQLLSVVALFAREKQLILMLKSKMDPSEAKILLRVLCGMMMLILVLQLLVVAVICSGRHRARDNSGDSEAAEA